MKNTALNTGEMLTNYFNTKRIRRAALARKMGIMLQSLTGSQKTTSIQTDKLWKFCYALEHNFFADIAHQLPATFTTTTDVQADSQQKIAALEKEIEKLKIEKEMLMLMVKG